MNKLKMKTVQMNERGVIVIPEKMREDLGLEGKQNLVLIERGNEIIVKREKEVIELLTDNDFWKKASEESLKRAWDKKDDVWDDVVK